MAINLKTTKGVSAVGVNVLAYGQAGAGKTTLVSTLPNPFLISVEGGLLSLARYDIPCVEIATLNDIGEVYNWLVGSDEARQYDSVALDSISEVAEVVLSAEKETAKDPRQAYGAMQDHMNVLIRMFRDLPKHVYFTAKLEKSQDEMGRLLYSPSMPGNKVGQALPYFFDEVLAVRCEPDELGNPTRYLLCQPDGNWQAKDRSGVLDKWEQPHLGGIIDKIMAGGK